MIDMPNTIPPTADAKQMTVKQRLAERSRDWPKSKPKQKLKRDIQRPQYASGQCRRALGSPNQDRIISSWS